MGRLHGDFNPHAQWARGRFGVVRSDGLCGAACPPPGQKVALPLDIRRSTLHERVRQALGQIRRGRTVSFSRFAAMIGQSMAARAVARGRATNAVAVAVSCQRIVRGSGACPNGAVDDAAARLRANFSNARRIWRAEWVRQEKRRDTRRRRGRHSICPTPICLIK